MRILKIIFIILVLVGLAISSYLTYMHFNDSGVVCIDKNTFNYISADSDENSCNSVLQSEYSNILGIPTSILGILFYLGVLISFLFSHFKENIIYKKILLVGTTTGILFSAFFTYNQFFILKSFCVYCFISACITVLLFGISIYFLKKILNKY